MERVVRRVIKEREGKERLGLKSRAREEEWRCVVMTTRLESRWNRWKGFGAKETGRACAGEVNGRPVARSRFGRWDDLATERKGAVEKSGRLRKAQQVDAEISSAAITAESQSVAEREDRGRLADRPGDHLYFRSDTSFSTTSR